MKNIMTMNEISAIATAKVNEFIEKGYVFNFGTMAGSQGDEFYADLVKGDITYRVRIYYKREDINCRRLVLEVRKVEKGFVEDSLGNTIWNNDGEIVESHYWYRLENRNGCVYTDDIEGYEVARELHRERRMNKRDSEVSVISPERILERVRSHRGYKRTEVSDIKRVYRTTVGIYSSRCHLVYIVKFNNLVSKTAGFELYLNN